MSILEQQLRIRLQPKQSELWSYWDDQVTDVLGGGGSRGGAKSGIARRGQLLRRLKYPRSNGLLLRRTLKELQHSHITELFREYPALRGWYREQAKELRLPNGSILFFGSAGNEKDVADFCSAEYADITIDEAQEFNQTEMEKLSGSNRCTSNGDIMPKMTMTFMPSISESGLPPIGLHYLKRVFIEKDLKGPEKLKNWVFIQSFSWDNFQWARKELDADGVSEEDFYSWSDADRREYFITRTEYGRKLASLTNTHLRDAWLYGKWDVFQGQYFPNFHSLEWVDDRGQLHPPHVLPADEVRSRIKPWHKKWVSLDWGYDHPFTVHWHAQDEKGRVITYREMWGRGMEESKLGREIGKLSAGDKLIAFPCSWDAGKLSPRAMKDLPKSIVQLITDALPKEFTRPFPADSSAGTRVSGARLLSQLLDADMWHISEDCPRLIECLPSLVRDPKNTEDVLKVDYSTNQIGDDSYDCARMGLQYMLGSSRRPQAEIIAEQARTIEDPVARALFIHKQTYAAQDKARGVKPASIPSWQKRL